MKKLLLALALPLLFWITGGGSAFAKKVKKPTPIFSYLQYEGICTCDSLPLREGWGGAVIPGWASDPSICRVGNDYWLVTSTFGYFPGVPLYHSTDLIHWELVRNILDRPSQVPSLSPSLGSDGVGPRVLDREGIYAATIRYNEQNKTYYMITTDVGKHGGHFYVTAKDPRGEWSDPTWLPEIDGIDPSFFFDDNGEAYIIYKEDVTGQPKWNNHRALRIIRFDVATGKTIGKPVDFLEEGVGPEEHLARDEGPHIYKISRPLREGRGGSSYILVAAEGGTGIYHSAVCYKADNVFGPWTRWSRNPMLTQRLLKAERPHAVTCSGHADLVETPEGKWYAVFLAMRTRQGLDLGRETFLMPVSWSKDGFPYITQEKDTVPDCSPSISMRLTDDTNPAWLTAPCAPGYRGIRLQHHQFTLSTEINLDALHKQGKTKAGLMFLKNESHQYRFLTDGYSVSLLQIGKNGRATILQTIQMGNGEGKQQNEKLTMTVKSDGKNLILSMPGLTATPQPVDITYLSGSGFTGITVGEFVE